MAIITTDNQHYADIAAAIREKNGSETQYRPDEMAAAISAIVSGGGGGEIKFLRTTQTTTITVPDDFTDIKQLLCIGHSSNYNGVYFFDTDHFYSEQKDIAYGIGCQVYSSADGSNYYNDAKNSYLSILKDYGSSAYTTVGAKLTGNKLTIAENYRLSNTPLSSTGDKIIFYKG